MHTKFAANLAQLRAERGMTQRELAALVGVAWSMISKYESGQSMPRLKILIRLANALGVPVGQLRGDEVVDNLEITIEPEHQGFIDRLVKITGLPPEQAFAVFFEKAVEHAVEELEGREPALITKGWPTKK